MMASHPLRDVSASPGFIMSRECVRPVLPRQGARSRSGVPHQQPLHRTSGRALSRIMFAFPRPQAKFYHVLKWSEAEPPPWHLHVALLSDYLDIEGMGE